GRGDVGLHQGLQVGAGVEGQRRGLQPNARGHDAAAGAVVECRRQDQRAHAPLAVVVRRLQQVGGLSGIHCRIVEVELGHAGSLTAAQPGDEGSTSISGSGGSEGTAGSSASTSGSTSRTREPPAFSTSPTMTVPVRGSVQVASCHCWYFSGS